MAVKGPRAARLALLAAGAATLAASLWAGLARLPAGPHLPPRAWILFHGPLMVSGVLGTLIGMERAVAAGRGWAYASPALAAAGSLALLGGASAAAGGWLFVLSAAALLLFFVRHLSRAPALHAAAMATGSAAWLTGNILWLRTGRAGDAVLWWAAFLVFVIAGERLELTRLLPPRPGRTSLFLVAAGLLLIGLALALMWPDPGARLAGAGLAALAAWFFRYDAARRTIRHAGLPRFAAACLLAGYGWLAAAGAILARGALPPAGFRYDAATHAIFLGFVFSMIFGHAPIVLPALLGIRIPFRRVFYAPLALLHLSLTVRLAGDALGVFPLRAVGGTGNVAAILLFLGYVACLPREGASGGVHSSSASSPPIAPA